MTGLGTGTVHKAQERWLHDYSTDARDVRLTPQGLPEFAASEKKARPSAARGAGLDEGQNFFFECESTVGRIDQAPALACELVSRRPDVLEG